MRNPLRRSSSATYTGPPENLAGPRLVATAETTTEGRAAILIARHLNPKGTIIESAPGKAANWSKAFKLAQASHPTLRLPSECCPGVKRRVAR